MSDVEETDTKDDNDWCEASPVVCCAVRCQFGVSSGSLATGTTWMVMGLSPTGELIDSTSPVSSQCSTRSVWIEILVASNHRKLATLELDKNIMTTFFRSPAIFTSWDRERERGKNPRPLSALRLRHQAMIAPIVLAFLTGLRSTKLKISRPRDPGCSNAGQKGRHQQPSCLKTQLVCWAFDLGTDEEMKK